MTTNVADGFHLMPKSFSELEVGAKFTQNRPPKNLPTVEYEKVEPVNKGGFIYNAKIVRTQKLVNFGHYEFVTPV